ncbi:uncharacterized protein LOC144669525 [Cetorhinus maximus]
MMILQFLLLVVQVIGNWSVAASPRKPRIFSSCVNCTEGDDILFSCIPPKRGSNYSFYKDGELLKVIKGEGTYGILKIGGVTASDQGKYSCENKINETNGMSGQSKSLLVYVQLKDAHSRYSALAIMGICFVILSILFILGFSLYFCFTKKARVIKRQGEERANENEEWSNSITIYDLLRLPHRITPQESDHHDEQGSSPVNTYANLYATALYRVELPDTKEEGLYSVIQA